jgi:hypothetical protein
MLGACPTTCQPLEVPIRHVSSTSESSLVLGVERPHFFVREKRLIPEDGGLKHGPVFIETLEIISI